MRYRWTVVALGVWCGLLGVLLIPNVAAAHSESAPAATNYRSQITRITPHVDGLRVRLVADGSLLELRNDTRGSIVVYGYEQEPYLKITRDGVFANAHSRTSYVNEDLSRNSREDGVQKGPAQWRRISDGSTARWHDHRTHWMGDRPPARVTDAPDEPHRLSNWRIAMTADDDTNITVKGTLDYLPPPRAAVWWAGILAVAALVALVGAWPRALPVLCGLLALAGLLELADGVSRVLSAGATGFGVPVALLTDETYGTVTALGALTAAGWALRGRGGAPFAVALGATCLTVLGAFTDIAVFSHGRATAVWDGDVARLATAATLALASGVALAGWMLVRREGGAPVADSSIKDTPGRRRGASSATPENGPLNPPPRRGVRG